MIKKIQDLWSLINTTKRIRQTTGQHKILAQHTADKEPVSRI